VKIKKLYQNILKLHEIIEILKELKAKHISPIEKHIISNSIYNSTGLFDNHYEEWRMRRINKMLELKGIDYFKDKTILELGGGHGDIGAFFAELGAEVLCLEGRIQNVNFARLKHRKINNFQCKQFDLEKDFLEWGHFDIIINFGLLYHLKKEKVNNHIKCCIKMSDEIFLETVVLDSMYNTIIDYGDPQGNDEAVNSSGNRMSSSYIENIFEQNEFKIIRCFTKDLDTTLHNYSWKPKYDNRVAKNLRRFWFFEK
jgi:SAM-dependent methyltransferase